MADCTYMPDCAFYHDRLDGMPYSKDYMKGLFCHRQSEACARHLYQHHKISRKVPEDLMPYEMGRAQQFMDGAS